MPNTITPSSSPTRLTIATRESRLAMWQAEHVQNLLKSLGQETHLLSMTTKGDQILDQTLSKIGGKGLFIKELELALLNKKADFAVHSLKDVPMQLDSYFKLVCVMKREDARDALVSSRYTSIEALPKGSVIGTSSLRRMAQLMHIRPDLNIQPLRGNLDTRLRKLDEGSYDAIVLAAAGLKRLGLEHRIASLLDSEMMLPAASQGALGIESLNDRHDIQKVLNPLIHMPTWLCVEAERSVSRELGGSCSIPLAAYATWDDSQIWLRATWSATKDATIDTTYKPLYAQVRAKVQTLDESRALGQKLAQQLIEQGAHV